MNVNTVTQTMDTLAGTYFSQSDHFLNQHSIHLPQELGIFPTFLKYKNLKSFQLKIIFKVNK